MEIISSEDSKSSNKLEGGVVDKLRDDFEKLLTSEKSVDVEIHIKEDGRSIFAHSLILEVRSKWFEAKIRHSQQNGKTKIDIESYSFQVISALINFLYTANTSNISQIADELLQAADEFEILDLKSVCEKKCLLRMNVDNVVNLLCIAYIHKANSLKPKAMEYIQKNFDEVKATEGWNKLREPKYNQLIMEMLEFVGSPNKRPRTSRSNE